MKYSQSTIGIFQQSEQANKTISRTTGIEPVVFLQHTCFLVAYSRICHNLARSQDHVDFNVSLAFPPKTWTAGFSGPFFFDNHTQLKEIPREDSWRGEMVPLV
jgi:hypothetical protein